MQNKFLHRAFQLALEHSSDGQHGPFGAIIVKNNEIIAEGWNAVVASNDPTAHAEIMAIRKACHKLGTFNLSECTIYSSCEPCPMCLAAIYWARIDTVVFAASHEDASRAGFDDSFLYEEMSKTWMERKINAFREHQDEGKIVFKKWIDNPLKIDY